MVLNVIEVRVSENETSVCCSNENQIFRLEFPPCGLCIAMMCNVTTADALQSDLVTISPAAGVFLSSREGMTMNDLVISRAPLADVSTCRSFQASCCAAQIHLSYFYCPDGTISHCQEFFDNFLQKLSSYTGRYNKSSSVHVVIVCPELCPGGVAGWSAVELNNGIVAGEGHTIVVSFQLVRRAFDKSPNTSQGQRQHARIRLAAHVIASLYHFSLSRSLSISCALFGGSCRASMWSQLCVLSNGLPYLRPDDRRWSAGKGACWSQLDVLRSSIISTYSQSIEDILDNKAAPQVETLTILRRPVCTLSLKHSITMSPRNRSWIRCELMSSVHAGGTIDAPFRLPAVAVPVFLMVCVVDGGSLVNCDAVEVQVPVVPHFSEIDQCEPQTSTTVFSWVLPMISPFTSHVEVLMVTDPFYSCPGIEFRQVCNATRNLADQAEKFGDTFAAMLLRLHAQQELSRCQSQGATNSAVQAVIAALEKPLPSLLDARIPRLAALAVMILIHNDVDEQVRVILLNALRALAPSPLLCPFARSFGGLDEAAIELDFAGR